ncbi:MAG: 3-keto-5-aminohexanoate cleavage protein [Lachnospiraceae bacterium]|nr:3-keto-5-aminohexanoate cleavage protein [Lachnospiraceae bacterium]
MDKVILSVAPVCATPHDINSAEIAEDVYECYKQGAAMVHLHVRDKNAALTPDLSLLEETVRFIREKCDIIIEISTGGVSDLTIEERCQPVYADFTEAVSLNVGSVNLGKSVYQNPIDDVKFCVRELTAHGKFPETELFELGMVNTMAGLVEEFDFTSPILLALVFGHEGELPATENALRHMVQYVKECFRGREDIIWGYTQANRRNWDMMRYALNYGAGSLRVGFEDSDYLDDDTRVDKNSLIVKRAAELIRECGKEPASAMEARRILNIKGA